MPVDVMASDRSAAHIAAALGATRMDHGTVAYCLRKLRREPKGRMGWRYYDRDRVEKPHGALLDHCMTFFVERQVLAILRFVPHGLANTLT